MGTGGQAQDVRAGSQSTLDGFYQQQPYSTNMADISLPGMSMYLDAPGEATDHQAAPRASAASGWNYSVSAISLPSLHTLL